MAAPAAPAPLKLDPTHDHYDFPTTSPEPQAGHPGYLTPEQESAVDQLRMLLDAEGCEKRLDTLTLLRFLRARKFDVMLAKKMFMECETWRKETKLDELLPTWDFPEKPQVFEYYPQFYHKTDKDGRPVYIEQLGSIDLTAMYNITSAERMLTNLAVEYERVGDPRLPACSRKAGHLLETCCTIMDLKGVSITRIPQVYSHVQQVSTLSQNYYPERLGRLYLLNAPWGFSTVWSYVKKWIDPITVEKIHILGSNYKEELLQQVPAENLPKAFGGTCACEGGCEYSDAGPWHDPQWTRPPHWQKSAAPEADKTKAADAVVENTGAEAVNVAANSANAGTV